MKALLIIGLGGAIGSILRYLMQAFVGRYAAVFPLGTFLVNIIGCFFIGLLYGLANKHIWMSLEWRLFLATGICGGFTTFSGFSYENMSLLKQGNYLYFWMYASMSVIIGLLATMAGAAVAK